MDYKMGIFSNTPQNDTQNAMNTLQKSQQAAANSLYPYTSNAGYDFNNERDYLYSAIGEDTKFGNVGSQFNNYADINPIDLLNEIMSGYTMSLGAQNQIKAGISGANNLATTTGMFGSGDNQALDAEITSGITGQDEQQYLKNVGGVTNEQLKFVQNYRNQLNGLMKAFGGMTSKEYNASNSMAGIDKSLGQTGANIQSRESDMKNPVGEAIGTLLGSITHMLMPQKVKFV